MRNRGWALFLLLAPSLSIPFEVLAQSRQGKTPSKALVGTTLARSDPCYQRLAATEKLTSYAITIPPRGSTLLGSHPADYLLLSLVDSQLEVTGPSGNTYAIQLGQEEMQVMKGGWTHRLTNLGDRSARLIEVDVEHNIRPEHASCGLAATPCTDGRFGKTEEGTYSTTTLFETPTVKLTRVELGPRGTFERHTHRGSEMLIALTPIHLSQGALENVDKAPGETRAYPAGTTHQIRNIGSEAARFLELEAK